MLIKSLQSRSIFAGALVIVVVFLSACSSSSLRPVGSLVPASDAQFTSPISVTVIDGTSGLERTVNNKSYWWVTSPSADIEVVNVAAAAATIVLSTTVIPPPCASALDLVVNQVDSPAKQIHAGTNGVATSLALEIPPGQKAILKMSVLTAGCSVPNDPRKFFAGLVDLKASAKK